MMMKSSEVVDDIVSDSERLAAGRTFFSFFVVFDQFVVVKLLLVFDDFVNCLMNFLVLIVCSVSMLFYSFLS